MDALHITPHAPAELAGLVLRDAEEVRLVVAALRNLGDYMLKEDPRSAQLRTAYQYMLYVLYSLLRDALPVYGAHSEAQLLWALSPEKCEWERFGGETPEVIQRLRELFDALGVFPYV